MLSTFTLPGGAAGLLDLLTDAKFEQVAPVLHRWYTPDVLRAQLREDLDEEIERVFSDEFAAAFRQHAPIPGVERDDAYKNRVLNVPHLGTALVGIRFRALDLSRPFVTVVAHMAPWPNPAGVQEATAFLCEQFAEFAPKHVVFFVPAGVQVHLSDLPPGSHWDQHVIAGPLSTLRTHARPAFYDRVTLSVPDDLTFYPRYAEAYDRLYAEHAGHREFARVEAEEDLADLREQGLLFEVHVDSAWAGIVAASRSAEQGLRGFVVVEMLLDAAHRGRGFGPAVGRHLVERLAGEAGDVLYGTVHHGNHPARRSAARAGREDLGAFLWVSTQE